MPKASIIIPCYNAERYLAATVQSALAQTMGDIEIICVDNNSTDGTPKILKELARQDHRIVLAKESEPGEGPTRDHGEPSQAANGSTSWTPTISWSRPCSSTPCTKASRTIPTS